MGKIFKFGCLGVIALIVIGVIIGAMGGGDSTEKTSTEPKQETKKEEKKKITLADYDSIKAGDAMSGEGGDTYQDIVSKFGDPSNTSDSQTGEFKMSIASWTKNINGNLGANFTLTFVEKDGAKRVSSKSQSGMK
ncbi:hypothetical protein KFD70_22150 [Bacillus pfraonensis]|uniref:hypothetical protein n=1 Tax=Bacillus pfraonensis TaxID=2830844 RepID=UPI003D6E2AC7